MNPEEAEKIMLSALRRVAPEADPKTLDRDKDLREQLDLDSMDVLNLAAALSKAIGADIPERDYKKLMALSSGVAYLGARKPKPT